MDASVLLENLQKKQHGTQVKKEMIAHPTIPPAVPNLHQQHEIRENTLLIVSKKSRQAYDSPHKMSKIIVINTWWNSKFVTELIPTT